MRVHAALLESVGGPLDLAELDLGEPERDEVLVRLHASGVCRSDLSLVKGYWPVPLPMVLGHEGAGMIEAVGAGVDDSRVGERVVLTFAPVCGRCRFCLEGRVNLCEVAAAGFETGLMPDGTTRLSRAGRPVYHLAFVSSFATHAVVPAAAAIPVGDDVDLGLACLLGCGVTTGVLSVTKRANVRPGESVAVFGCGGVGLSAVQGARLVSAWPIVAVDPAPMKRELALALGASHVVDPGEVDPVEAVRAASPGGVDHAFEAIGKPDVARQAFAATRQGGTTVLIGQPAIGVDASFSVYELTQFEHTVLGSNLGAASPALDVPTLARLLAAGKLDLATLVTHRLPLDRVNEAIALVESGDAGRVILELGTA
jgi:Zn-dependent alcohol dehydrogenase